ncbi:tripartite tricarboxylate transporter permease [Acuticoccus kandeliae]|uniref:tripartite tricarboxylate transporter permease n=1 Tax=Acuticoccus kandeliae TaxID=2073160 RepID=UPI000D3ED289|nr:tripartite tricarboxylate transporter permease [Acuticoccus kandeliae]
MFDLQNFLDALPLVFNVNCLFWLVVGVTVGVGVGALPGLTAVTGVALMLPLTFQMEVASALGLLIGLYKGAIFGSSISAISFATPGAPEAAVIVDDGYRLTRAGKGKKAILMALYSSVTGDLASDILVILIAPVLAVVALQFGPSERFWIMMMAIILIGALSGRHFAKALISAGIGMFIATIGTDPIGAVPRNTFGIWWLRDGIDLIPLVIGIFALGRMLEEMAVILSRNERVSVTFASIRAAAAIKGEGLKLREYLSSWKVMTIGIVLGTLIGMLPGLGATAAAFIMFGIAMKMTGGRQDDASALTRIAAAEAGNSATVGPTLVPLLVFGIPGSAVAALIGGALMLHGATPSPRMFELHGEIIYALFVILILGNFVNLGIGRFFALIYARLGMFPREILIPLVIVLAVVGTYAYMGNPYHVVLMLVFGLLGFAMRVLGIPEGPLVITFMITPMAEGAIRRALLISRGDWLEALFKSPLAIGASLAIVVLVAAMRFARSKEGRAASGPQSRTADPENPATVSGAERT